MIQSLKNPIFKNALKAFSDHTNVTDITFTNIYFYVDNWMAMKYKDNFKQFDLYPKFDN